MLVGDFVWLFRCHRLLRNAALPWKIAISAFNLAQAFGLVLILSLRWGDHGLRFLLSAPVFACIYLWHFLFIVPMMLVWIPLTVAKMIAAAGRMLSGTKRVTRDEADAPISRRDFIRAAAATAPALCTLGVTGISLAQLRHFRVRKMDANIPGLPAALDGLTIAHVTDLHVGQFTHGAILDEIVEATNSLRADLVVSTGDLINFDLKDLAAGLNVITRLRAEHGVFMCEGNHDLFENADEFRRRTREAGVRLLVNQNATISIRGTPVQILGLPWGSGSGHPHAEENHGEKAIAGAVQRLLAQRQPDAFAMMLAHHPHAFDYADGVPLMFAGHTHGGQLMITGELGCGPMIYRYWSGLYRRAESTLIVANGVGNWFPLRTAAPAEIIHLTLRRA